MASDMGVLPGPSVERSDEREMRIELQLSLELWKKKKCGDVEKQETWEVRNSTLDCTYSNCNAAILLGNPVTRHVISHGRNESRDVLTAPPLDSPLCCLRRRTGLGVLPT